MSKITDLNQTRVRRATDSMEITVVQLLRDLADQIDEGLLNPVGATIVMLNKTGNGGEQVRVHRAQIGILEESGLLTIAQMDSARVLTE